MAMSTRFTFTGEPVLPKKDAVNPFVRRFKGGKNNSNMASLNFGVRAGNSIGFVELFGMESDKIYSMDSNNQRCEVAWDDRNNPDVISNIASYRKHFINLTSDDRNDTETFIAAYDAISYIEENLANAKKVTVTGTVDKEPYISKEGNEVYIDKYNIQNIYFADENAKPKLRINMDFYYTKDSVDKSDFKAEKIITVDGYIRQYLRSTKTVETAVGVMNKEVFMPQKAVLNASKLDMSNELHKKILASQVAELECSNAKKLYHCAWECSLVNGAEEVEWDESQLTPKQRLQIELGEKTADDFRPRGQILGSRVRELRLVRPDFYGDFENGVIEADYTLKELEEELVKFIKPESLDDLIAKDTAAAAKETNETDLSDLDSLDDLFE